MAARTNATVTLAARRSVRRSQLIPRADLRVELVFSFGAVGNGGRDAGLLMRCRRHDEPLRDAHALVAAAHALVAIVCALPVTFPASLLISVTWCFIASIDGCAAAGNLLGSATLAEAAAPIAMYAFVKLFALVTKLLRSDWLSASLTDEQPTSSRRAADEQPTAPATIIATKTAKTCWR